MKSLRVETKICISLITLILESIVPMKHRESKNTSRPELNKFELKF